MIFKYLELYRTIFLVHLLSILVYHCLSRSSLGYLGLNRSFSLSEPILGYPCLYLAVLGYVRLSQAIVGYFGQSLAICGYLSLAISGYFWLSGVILGYLRIHGVYWNILACICPYPAISGYL